MKLSDKIATYNSSRPFYTFEFFPPRTDQGFENLIPRISRLSTLNPLAISVTWGAGGSTRERSIDLAGLTQSDYGIDTVLHLTCTNMVPGMVDDALRAAKARGIQNILALRGDPSRGTELWTPVDSQFTCGIDLVKYIRSSPEFSSHFCIGVAAYPEGHPDRETDEDSSLNVLKEKVDAGADFIVTQLFYDADPFLEWVDKVRAKGITVPIIPGVMPIQTYSSFLRLIKLCGVKVPPSVMTALEPICHDDQLVKDYGVGLAVDIIRKITSTGTVKGIHFCTLNLEKSVQLVIEKLQWAGGSPTMKNRLIADAPGPMIHVQLANSSDLVIDPTTATNTATNALTFKQTLDPDPGRGELNNAATWDDFPNGRFGDYKSPAFGAQDQWGGSGLCQYEGLSEWGHPKSTDDLTSLVLRYLHSEVSSSPFSSLPLSPESLTILPYLEQLTKRGWWTVCSQPAVDGASSTDEIFGWGPRGGYVYQKGFVEFFVEEQDLANIEKKIEEEGQGWVHYFAGNLQGECRSNVPDDGRNAVTWGMFPGQEITQTTIIERESFLTWKDEAFSIWAEWASFYPPGSEERELLNSVRKERWLVSIVHHDYKRPDALWTFLLDGEFPL
ncbi:methylenetetrahydrofolate reductase-domain-containing protein [Suillus subalutaceus]|uniref:methylenetetrahydrofolate reductase-domain-containing protein n=1 Tax=Suillus subalutaceus TaxID=48586 RepID=UPI001B876557|nr:methylenetetrahydrofolate reductase-domain-containing protein [Suillus subalutaceus]KAG1858047.1 methylenetetrahydrofolate reductase-domain-containing protein [Suillus subalutaceus]